MMSTGFGFCPTCGAPRTAAEQRFCAVCGSAFAAGVSPAPPAPQVAGQTALPPPPPPQQVPTVGGRVQQGLGWGLGGGLGCGLGCVVAVVVVLLIVILSLHFFVFP